MNNQRKAFLHAYTVLAYCEHHEIHASAELFYDGSGYLKIFNPENVAHDHRIWLQAQLHSNRWEANENGHVILTSCHGWHE